MLFFSLSHLVNTHFMLPRCAWRGTLNDKIIPRDTICFYVSHLAHLIWQCPISTDKFKFKFKWHIRQKKDPTFYKNDLEDRTRESRTWEQKITMQKCLHNKAKKVFSYPRLWNQMAAGHFIFFWSSSVKLERDNNKCQETDTFIFNKHENGKIKNHVITPSIKWMSIDVTTSLQ